MPGDVVLMHGFLLLPNEPGKFDVRLPMWCQRESFRFSVDDDFRYEGGFGDIGLAGLIDHGCLC